MLSDFLRSAARAARKLWQIAVFGYQKPRELLLVGRMAVWVVLFPIQVRLLPLPRALAVVAPRQASTTRSGAVAEERLAHLLDLLLGTNFILFTPTCWKRAAVLHRYLALNGVQNQIVFGVRT